MNKQTPSGFVATESQTRHEKVDILKQTGNQWESHADTISVEEPLEIRIAGPGFEDTTLAITMRTPGCDHEGCCCVLLVAVVNGCCCVLLVAVVSYWMLL